MTVQVIHVKEKLTISHLIVKHKMPVSFAHNFVQEMLESQELRIIIYFTHKLTIWLAETPK